MRSIQDTAAQQSESSVAIFLAFLKLGLVSFGGPIAHLGYFRDEFVNRRRWLSEANYGDLVALCQFLPGPASSQVGFALGVLRANGLLGGLAAWLGFTMPSAILMAAFALTAAAFTGFLADGFLHGLKLVAVAVVAQAVWGMARTLAPDGRRAAIAFGALVIVNFSGTAAGQIIAIALGALSGFWLCRGTYPVIEGRLAFPITRRAGIAALILFAALLLGLPIFLAATGNRDLSLFYSFYRSGALVFGGGHVVLPLLQAEMVATGWVSKESFLAGYGMVQAMPGPLFTFAAYLGAASAFASHTLAGATIALVAVFLPGLLIVVGVLPFWNRFCAIPAVQYAMGGANAAVVGILGAALYDPVWRSAVFSARDFTLALGGFMLLTIWKAAPWVVVVLLTSAAILLKML